VPISDVYDAKGEGGIVGTVLAQMYQAGVIPLSVGNWIVNNASNAANSPVGIVDGYKCEIYITENTHGVYFLNEFITFPSGSTY
jgi:hypothetical protein